MRNFSKTLISMAAVMAVGSAMAAGAMAGELTITETVKKDGKFKIDSGITTERSQYTLLVLAQNEEGKYEAAEGTIKQIDQHDDGSIFDSVVVGDLADGTYKVMVGNDKGGLDEGYFTVSTAVTPEPEIKTLIIGDVDGDDMANVDPDDASCVLLYYIEEGECIGSGNAGKEVIELDTGKTFIVGDVDGDDMANIDPDDASCILLYYIEEGECIGSGNAGIEVQYTE